MQIFSDAIVWAFPEAAFGEISPSIRCPRPIHFITLHHHQGTKFCQGCIFQGQKCPSCTRWEIENHSSAVICPLCRLHNWHTVVNCHRVLHHSDSSFHNIWAEELHSGHTKHARKAHWCAHWRAHVAIAFRMEFGQSNISMTTDYASNMETAFAGPNWKQIHCVAHTFNLCVDEGA